MSRSIHTTRRTFSKIGQKRKVSEENRQFALKKAGDTLNQKRRIKRMVKKERRERGPLPPSSVVSTIPIEVLDESEFVHHGASVDDIRAILEALPESARLGIHRIQLSLGKSYMEKRAEAGDAPDPITGRLGCELFRGVFCGAFLGTFRPDSGLVSMYAYVYDATKTPLPARLCELYLRLHALKTFVHEIAHHHDQVHRTARGRWRADRRETVEIYAEKMEHEWTRTIVLPYLRQAYPRDVAELINWVERHGGLRMDLDFFAGDSRRTMRNGFERLVCSTASAFQYWLDEIAAQKSPIELRLALAWEIHYCDMYEKCLELLTSILAVSPDWAPALVCKGDTLIHLENYDDAQLSARRVLQLEPGNSDAWKIIGDVFWRRREWSELLNNCDLWECAGELSQKAKRDLLLHRAIAFCALDKIREMEATVAAYLALFTFKTEEMAARRKKGTMSRVFRSARKPVPVEYLPEKK